MRQCMCYCILCRAWVYLASHYQLLLSKYFTNVTLCMSEVLVLLL